MNIAKRKIGIIVVAYNSSNVVRVTLAGLIHAKSDLPLKIIFIDNGSKPSEAERLRESFAHYSSQSRDEWVFLRSDKNLGFSGGNNLGITALLKDETVTHICLLNSDVIVTDFWIDRLVEKNCEAISPVTNRAEGEQCVPIDYELKLTDIIDENLHINTEAFARVNSFALSRFVDCAGNLAQVDDVTFFCVVLSRHLVETVGFLDTNFFPGGFEDVDYCIRILAKGFALSLARDVFIHHWGSASFNQLNLQYFKKQTESGKRYLEEKHSIQWKIRPQVVFSSYRQDLIFFLKNAQERQFLHYNKIFQDNLTMSVQHFSSEYKILTQWARNIICCPGDMPLFYNDRPDDEILTLWNVLTGQINALKPDKLLSKDDIATLEKNMSEFELAVMNNVQINIALSNWINSHHQNSTSWKVTAPIRKIANLFRNYKA